MLEPDFIFLSAQKSNSFNVYYVVSDAHIDMQISQEAIYGKYSFDNMTKGMSIYKRFLKQMQKYWSMYLDINWIDD